ncbi:DNA primase large subunit [Neodiprion lecontei]|uniref:DNA primase large subunit n=1 Tax=Neodiprion lecontei TaxID=441921 RepID=A0A6J0B5Q0_NEOLC|nr:DNA primase large subunit [Neodiprion lecontei]XP_015509477.1 DNA primase large subunit [Neodiprion lecontei]XP_046589165.1 DNA primase large subunit [Neodiprion lecontei]
MFYIQPPRGVLAFNTLTSCIDTRIDYLELVYDNKVDSFEGNIEYLFEGSKYDRTGHFTLRLLASASNDLWAYWVTRETILLEYRLGHVSQRQIHRMFKNIQNSVESTMEYDPLHAALHKISTFFLQRDIFSHIIGKNHSNYCEDYSVKLKFQTVPDLIKKRLVDLREGDAIIFCSRWKQLIKSLFKSLLWRDKANLEKGCLTNTIKSDPRLNFIHQRIELRLMKGGQIGNSRITVNNIDSEVYNFPLCMSHLHFTLRRLHRLSHNARFYYSLFLKDSGMTVDESLVFWRLEYSQPHTCTCSCSHNWQSDTRRFTYSIRHLYGLEGSRKNYNTPNCSVICNNTNGPRYEGGCPFKSFDRDKLKELLRRVMKQSNMDSYLDTFSKQKPEVACASFLKSQRMKNIDNTFINSPVQYYQLMKEYD